MKTAFILVLGLTMSAAAMAEKIDCKSLTHGLLIDGKSTNYSVNGENNSEADVVLEKVVKDGSFLTASISIDGQPGHMRVAAIKKKDNTYEGKLQVFNNKIHNATCTVTP